MLWMFLSVAVIGLFWLVYHHPRRRRWLLPRQVVERAPISAVDRQHKHLLAGGRFGEAAVAAAAARFQELLRNGRTAELEQELRPGMDFALQVQALTRIGTAEASGVLERQLSRRLSRDPVEQTWYWADAASGLRQLCHAPALPALLRCADTATGFPACTVLAAEVVAFPNFSATLTDMTGPLARSALRAIARVARGCRDGAIDPGSMLAIGLGDILATLSETAPPIPDPWLTAAILEADRMSRRIGHWKRLLAPGLRPVAERQEMRLCETSRQRVEWLRTAPARLIKRFSISPTNEQTAILLCLFEFRSDIICLFPHLPDRRVVWWAEAVRCLMWSQSSAAGPVLARQASELMTNRRHHYLAIPLIATLRGHPCPESERVLLRAAATTDPELRQAAAAALGWWPPINPGAVVGTLRTLRTDPIHTETRRAAVAALARLGERTALQEIRDELLSEEPAIRAAAANRIALEELSWLWPDLQEVADSEDPQTALAALEAIERLREQILGPLG
ncbi:MAG TPA: HEAT repeat domain-containing protein [Gemmata sp.]|nr:HEAT repeat domain-containing protein [Gemmata sp.]